MRYTDNARAPTRDWRPAFVGTGRSVLGRKIYKLYCPICRFTFERTSYETMQEWAETHYEMEMKWIKRLIDLLRQPISVT